MDAFRFQDPQGGVDGVTWLVTLRTIEPELKWQDLREIVADILLSHDGLDYKIGDFVVLPDRLETLVGIYPARDVNEQARGWIARSTSEINTHRHRSGDFWQSNVVVEQVRDWEDFDSRRKALRRTPREAGLRVGEYYLHLAADD